MQIQNKWILPLFILCSTAPSLLDGTHTLVQKGGSSNPDVDDDGDDHDHGDGDDGDDDDNGKEDEQSTMVMSS